MLRTHEFLAMVALFVIGYGFLSHNQVMLGFGALMLLIIAISKYMSIE